MTKEDFADQLIGKWRPVLDATNEIFSWSGEGELAYWAERASLATKAIEMGTHFGRSAKVMLLASPNLHLTCVDLFLQDGTLMTAKHFLKDEYNLRRCDILKTTSPDAANLLYWEKGNFDFVMVDDGHTYEDVRRDIRSFFPLLKIGGHICGHDLDAGGEVEKAVNKMLPGWFEPVNRVWAFDKTKEITFT